jgi:hypothetical protein
MNGQSTAPADGAAEINVVHNSRDSEIVGRGNVSDELMAEIGRLIRDQRRAETE